MQLLILFLLSFPFYPSLLLVPLTWIIPLNNFIHFLLFPGFPPQLMQFLPAVRLRLFHAYRPSTRASHRLACVALALFCLRFSLPFHNLTLPSLLSFLQFLSASGLSPPTIKNYFSSVKSYFAACSIPTEVFLSPQLSLSLSSLEKNTPPSAIVKPIFSPSQLIALFSSLSILPLHALYRVAFSFAFLAMLRISNLAPPSSSSFDPFQHLRRGDITLHSDHLVIWLRWTKTLQCFNQTAHISLFPIPGSLLCPLS
jgi:integrase